MTWKFAEYLLIHRTTGQGSKHDPSQILDLSLRNSICFTGLSFRVDGLCKTRNSTDPFPDRRGGLLRDIFDVSARHGPGLIESHAGSGHNFGGGSLEHSHRRALIVCGPKRSGPRVSTGARNKVTPARCDGYDVWIGPSHHHAEAFVS